MFSFLKSCEVKMRNLNLEGGYMGGYNVILFNYPH